MTQNIAVYGLGSMGYGIAQSILRAGHTTWGADINAGRHGAVHSRGRARRLPSTPERWTVWSSWF